MQFSFTTLFAIVLTAAFSANAAPGSQIEAKNTDTASSVSAIKTSSFVAKPNPETFNVGQVWTEANLAGAAGSISVGGIPSGCVNLVVPFASNVTSIQTQSGIRCSFFTAANCQGAEVIIAGATAPNLGGTNFDKSLLSLQCFAM